MKNFINILIILLPLIIAGLLLIVLISIYAKDTAKEYKDIITNREYIYVNKGYNVTFNNIETSGTTILKDKHVNYFILVDSVTLSKRFISLNQ